MKIEHGPPAFRGVKSLQYVGDDADFTQKSVAEIAKPAATLGAGVYVYAWIVGNRSLKLVSLGVTLASLFIHVSTKVKEAK